jgi:two-component system, chemotaxis family, sensor kinase CheA
MSDHENKRQEVVNQIEVLSEELVFADPSDLQALAALHTKFELLAESTKNINHLEASEASKKITTILEKIILNEIEKPESGLNLISQTLSVIQMLICEGRKIEEVSFPDELGSIGTEQLSVNDDSKKKKSKNKPMTISLPKNVDMVILSRFLEEQQNVLEKIEELILELEKDDDFDKLAEFRRIIHTLKGECGMLGLRDVEKLCHIIEDALNRDGIQKNIDNLLKMKDWLEKTYGAYSGKGVLPNSVDTIIKLFEPKDEAKIQKPLVDETPLITPVEEEEVIEKEDET